MINVVIGVVAVWVSFAAGFAAGMFFAKGKFMEAKQMTGGASSTPVEVKPTVKKAQ